MRERHPGRGSESGGVITATREYEVTLSGAEAGDALVAQYASGIPNKGDQYPVTAIGKAVPVCVDKDAKLLDDKNQSTWLVTVEYSNAELVLPPQEQPIDNETEPWERDPVYDYDFIDVPWTPTTDFSSPSKSVLNSVGDPFDPPIQLTKKTRKIIITTASQSWSSTTAGALIDCVNNAPITINGETIAAKSARLLVWKGTPATWTDTDNNEHDYFEIVIEILLDNGLDDVSKEAVAGGGSIPLSHAILVPNTGYRAITSTEYEDGDTVQITGRIFDDSDQPITVPAFLTDTDDETTTGRETTEPTYRRFEIYEAKSFTPLGLT